MSSKEKVMSRGERGAWGFVVAGVLVCLVLAGVVSAWASGQPDGLERVAEDHGFLEDATDSAAAGSPLADYGVAGVADERLSVGLAGVAGVIITLVLGFGLFRWLGRGRRPRDRATGSPAGSPAARSRGRLMSAGHRHGHDVGERLYVHRHTPVHLLPAEVKVAALVLFVFVVVATPAARVGAFVAYAGVLAAVAAVARLSPGVVLPRMVVEVPFLLFAVLMPVLGPDPRTDVLGLSLSTPGLLAGWGIVAKGTIGVLAAIILAATTPTRDLLLGLERLHVPPLLVQIASFMLRYLHVVGAEMQRMAIARRSRGFEARGVSSWPVLAHSAGTLFVRSYERGERVHLAMLSRGYTGTMPVADEVRPARTDWLVGLALPTSGLVIAVLAWWLS